MAPSGTNRNRFGVQPVGRERERNIQHNTTHLQISLSLSLFSVTETNITSVPLFRCFIIIILKLNILHNSSSSNNTKQLIILTSIFSSTHFHDHFH
ncbi:hypothetical protein QVD17_16452 [Tagetes erecta]|uniref:Uncharacterized protein n=1 Tax=Tagetes erecta TaxID=13708 RepID=A0AAD8NZN4_TARER|nr:hypothetical protein QVD17_16452 [Tagetes erecta]